MVYLLDSSRTKAFEKHKHYKVVHKKKEEKQMHFFWQIYKMLFCIEF